MCPLPFPVPLERAPCQVVSVLLLVVSAAVLDIDVTTGYPIIRRESFLLPGTLRRSGGRVNAFFTSAHNNIAIILCVSFTVIDYLRRIRGQRWHPDTAVLLTPRVAATEKTTGRADRRLKPALVIRGPPLTASIIMPGLQDSHVVNDLISTHAVYPICLDLEQHFITRPEKIQCY